MLAGPRFPRSTLAPRLRGDGRDQPDQDPSPADRLRPTSSLPKTPEMGSIQALHLESSRRRHRDENGLRDWNTFSHRLSHPPVTAFCGLPPSATSPRAVEPPKEPATRTRGGCLSPISATDLLSREPGKPRSSRVAWLALLRPPLLPLTLSTAPTRDRRSQKLPRGRRLARRHRRPRVVTRLEPRRPAVSISVRAPLID